MAYWTGDGGLASGVGLSAASDGVPGTWADGSGAGAGALPVAEGGGSAAEGGGAAANGAEAVFGAGWEGPL